MQNGSLSASEFWQIGGLVTGFAKSIPFCFSSRKVFDRRMKDHIKESSMNWDIYNIVTVMVGYLPRLFGDIFEEDLDGKGKQFLCSIWRVVQARTERKMVQESSPFVEADALDMLYHMMDVLRQLEEGYGGRAKKTEEEKFKTAADYIADKLKDARILVGLARDKSNHGGFIKRKITREECDVQSLYLEFGRFLPRIKGVLGERWPQEIRQNENFCTYGDSGMIQIEKTDNKPLVDAVKQINSAYIKNGNPR
jgi:hypothetical protein